MLTDSTEGACCNGCVGLVVNDTLCSADTPGGTVVIIVIVSGTVSGINVECAGVYAIVVNGTVSSVKDLCIGVAIVGANNEVSVANIGGASVIEIGVMMFALIVFDNARDEESVVYTMNEGGLSGAVLIVALVVSCVVTASGTFPVEFLLGLLLLTGN